MHIHDLYESNSTISGFTYFLPSLNLTRTPCFGWLVIWWRSTWIGSLFTWWRRLVLILVLEFYFILESNMRLIWFSRPWETTMWFRVIYTWSRLCLLLGLVWWTWTQGNCITNSIARRTCIFADLNIQYKQSVLWQI